MDTISQIPRYQRMPLDSASRLAELDAISLSSMMFEDDEDVENRSCSLSLDSADVITGSQTLSGKWYVKLDCLKLNFLVTEKLFQEQSYLFWHHFIFSCV